MTNISSPLDQLCDVDLVLVVVGDGEKDGDAEVLKDELGPGRRHAGRYEVLIVQIQGDKSPRLQPPVVPPSCLGSR